jgi:hypothetical protein
VTKRVRVIEVRTGEALRIGDVLVVLEEKSGQRARLRVEAEDTVEVDRVRNEHNIRAVVGLGEQEPGETPK